MIPDNFTVSTLMSGYVNNKNIDKVLEIYKNLKNFNLKPNIIIYTNIIKAYININ